MNKKELLVVIALFFLTLSCGLSGKEKETKEPPAQEAPAKEQTTERKPAQPPQHEPTQEAQDEQPPQAPTKAVQPAGNPNVPRFFRDEFEGPLDEVNWSTQYFFYVDEGVEEGDEEATPIYTIEQERGAQKFYIESPWLYVYRIYNPHLYKDVRIDIEVENKGVNTNNISLFCRNTDYGWYEFIATSGGYYSIMRYYEDGDEELARGGIRSIKFGDKKKNVFTAICNSKTLTYIVNGVEIAKVKDEEIPDEGNVGFNVSAEGVVPVQVEVNWLEISEP